MVNKTLEKLCDVVGLTKEEEAKGLIVELRVVVTSPYAVGVKVDLFDHGVEVVGKDEVDAVDSKGVCAAVVAEAADAGRLEDLGHHGVNLRADLVEGDPVLLLEGDDELVVLDVCHLELGVVHDGEVLLVVPEVVEGVLFVGKADPERVIHKELWTLPTLFAACVDKEAQVVLSPFVKCRLLNVYN